MGEKTIWLYRLWVLSWLREFSGQLLNRVLTAHTEWLSDVQLRHFSPIQISIDLHVSIMYKESHLFSATASPQDRMSLGTGSSGFWAIRQSAHAKIESSTILFSGSIQNQSTSAAPFLGHYIINNPWHGRKLLHRKFKPADLNAGAAETCVALLP